MLRLTTGAATMHSHAHTLMASRLQPAGRPPTAQLTTACRRPSMHWPSRVISPLVPHLSRSIATGSSRGPHTRVKEHTGTRTHPDTTVTPMPTARPPSMAMPSTPSTTTPAGGRADAADTRSTAEVVLANVGLSEFLGRVYRVTGLSVASTLAIGYGVAMTGLPMSVGVMTLGGFVVSIGSLLALMFGKKPVTLRRPEDPTKLYTVNPPARQALYATFIAGNSFAIAPYVAAVSILNPMVVPAAVVATGLTMAGASFVAFKKPNGSLLSLAAPMGGALLGLIGLQLASFASVYFMGPNAFAAAMSTVYPYAGIGIFSVLTAIDTHMAVNEYQSGQADHLTHAVSFYLNAVNLVLDFMRIFSRDD